MNLQLITLQGVKLNANVYELGIPTLDGEIGVFPGHEPLVTIAVPGAITVRYHKGTGNDGRDFYAISGGIVEITPSAVRILVDEADHGADIIEAESQAALERAMALKENADSQVELEKAHQMVGHHAARLKVAELHRRHRRNQ